jgi:hypothetical protein
MSGLRVNRDLAQFHGGLQLGSGLL